MRPILAIDPGTTQSAWVLWDGRRLCGLGTDKNSDLLGHLGGSDVELPVFADVEHVAIEMIASYGMPVGREVFETCIWIGRFIQAWFPRSYELVFRQTVKLELCGSPRAKDANVRQVLLDRLGPKGTKKNPGPTYGVKKDEWAAIGVAVTAWDQAARAKIGRGNHDRM